MIVNIADPATPVLLGQLTGPAYGVRVVGQTAYVANGLSVDITIVDVADMKAVQSVPVGRTPHSIRVDD